MKGDLNKVKWVRNHLLNIDQKYDTDYTYYTRDINGFISFGLTIIHFDLQLMYDLCFEIFEENHCNIIEYILSVNPNVFKDNGEVGEDKYEYCILTAYDKKHFNIVQLLYKHKFDSDLSIEEIENMGIENFGKLIN